MTGVQTCALPISTRLSLDTRILAVGSWVDGNRDFSIPRLTAPGYTTVDVAANYDINSKLALLARVSNLFNRRFENPIGFQQPGVGAYAGIKLRL